LPSVNVEALIAQHLEWRDIERLKWRCGKLKCSLLYEVELYLDENKKYPKKWDKIKSKSCDDCWFVTWFNIMNETISAKDWQGHYYSISLPELKESWNVMKSKQRDSDRDRHYRSDSRRPSSDNRRPSSDNRRPSSDTRKPSSDRKRPLSDNKKTSPRRK